MEIFLTIVLGIIGGGALLKFIEFLIARFDKKVENPLIARFDILDEKIDNLKEEVDSKFNALDRKIDDVEATNARIRILQFSESLQRGQEKSKESYDQVHNDIDLYRNHCKKHADYPNSRAEDAIQNIEQIYLQKLKSQAEGASGFAS